MATIPPARPSSPSMRLMALAIPTTQRTDNKYDQSVESKKTPANGTRKTRIEIPEITKTLAAITIPATFAGAETSRRSSIAPTPAMTNAASTNPSGSVLPLKTTSNEPIHHAVNMPARTPSSMATPPRVGVDRSCTCRASGRTTAPIRTDKRRTPNNATNVVTATTAKTIAYAPMLGTRSKTSRLSRRE